MYGAPRRRRSVRTRALAGVLGAVAALGGVPVQVSADPSGVAVVAIEGRGFGHGVGLAQDGAYWMGRAGYGTMQILGQFFPGTSLARSSGTVRVLVQTAGGTETVLSFPDGGQVQDALTGQESPGFPVQVPAGGAADITWSGGRYTVSVGGGSTASPGRARRVEARAVAAAPAGPAPTPTTTLPVPTSTTSTTQPVVTVPPTTSTTAPAAPAPAGGATTTTTTAPATTTTTAPARPAGPPRSSTRPLWAVPSGSSTVGVPATGRTYRGVIETVANTSGGNTSLEVTNQVDVEDYLRGMGEVQNPSWPLTSLQAQVIVERTYALRAMAAAGAICDDQRCQVYLGTQAEYPAMDRAVSSTRGYVLAWRGALAATVFSANGGGFSASPQEGFGTSDTDYPYLRAAPYLTHDPMPWTVTVALSDVAGRLGYPGTLTGARVTATGPSGRALAVTLDGSAGSRAVSGITFAANLGLKSTFFGLTAGVSATPPPPPPPAAPPTQALPSDGSAVARALAAPVAAASPFGTLDAGDGRGPGGTGPLQWAALALAMAVAGATALTVLRSRQANTTLFGPR